MTPIFATPTVDAHAFAPPRPTQRNWTGLFAPADGLDVGRVFPSPRSRRAARRIVADPTANLGRRLETVSHGKPFWQVAPDGQTIERLYDPQDEPVDVQKEAD